MFCHLLCLNFPLSAFLVQVPPSCSTRTFLHRLSPFNLATFKRCIASLITRSLKASPSSFVLLNLDRLFHQCSGCVGFCSLFQTDVHASGSITQRQRVCCMSSLNSSAPCQSELSQAVPEPFLLHHLMLKAFPLCSSGIQGSAG